MSSTIKQYIYLYCKIKLSLVLLFFQVLFYHNSFIFPFQLFSMQIKFWLAKVELINLHRLIIPLSNDYFHGVIIENLLSWVTFGKAFYVLILSLKFSHYAPRFLTYWSYKESISLKINLQPIWNPPELKLFSNAFLYILQGATSKLLLHFCGAKLKQTNNCLFFNSVCWALILSLPFLKNYFPVLGQNSPY